MDCLSNITPTTPYDFDQQSGLSIVLPVFSAYGNIGCNDCVIAARAHHTIRLVWARSNTMPLISDTDVLNEYQNETGDRTCQDGINLADSLQQWLKGWAYGEDPVNGLTKHKIEDCCGPCRIDGCVIPSVPATWPTLTPDLLRAGIYSHIGAQINLNLPFTVKATLPNSYGPDHPWANMPDRSGDNHVVLLSGYDVAGGIDNFSGITWGKKQSMTWEFLQSHCWGAFFVQGGNNT
jgi:hypothetical protein